MITSQRKWWKEGDFELYEQNLGNNDEILGVPNNACVTLRAVPWAARCTSLNSRHFGGGGAEIDCLIALVGLLEEGLVKGKEEKDLHLENVVIGDREQQAVVMD